MSYMLSEIKQQPVVITGLTGEQNAAARKIAAEVKKRGINFVVMAARGTSDHSCVYGKYMMEICAAMPVALADPSVFTLYNAKLNLANALVIGVSQSGEAADVAEYLEHAKKTGAYTLSITNAPSSLLTKVADANLLCEAGQEKAVAATKTYTAELGVFYLLASAMQSAAHPGDDLARAAESMVDALALEETIKNRSERYRYSQSCTVIARGLNYCTALETALKLTETCYMNTRGFSGADFLHGPIAAVHEGDPCVILAPTGKAYPFMFDLAKRLHGSDADMVIVSDNDEILSMATVPLKMTRGLDETLTPLSYILAGQLLSFYLSLNKGNDPDQPRGLNKVTVTL